jgi:hypothetical protein
VRNEKDCFAAPLEFSELVEAFVREPLVADGEHFVDEENFGVDVNGDRESETHIHPGRVRFHRRVDEVLQLRKLHDLVKAAGNLALAQTEHDPVDEDVLAPGDFGVKSCAKLDERGDAAIHVHRATCRFGDAGDEFEQRALARSVAANDS